MSKTRERKNAPHIGVEIHRLKSVPRNLIVTALVCVAFVGCSNERRGNGEPPTAESAPASAAQVAEPASSPAPSAESASAPPADGPPAQPVEQRPLAKIPDFLDGQRIKDLPVFPKSSISNFSYGPLADADMVLVFFEAFDTFDNVTAFYDKAIRSNGWKINTRTCDIGDCVWRVSKGDRDEAIVQVKFDQQLKRVSGGINRSRKLVSQ